MKKNLILNWKHHWVDDWVEYIPLLQSYSGLLIAPPVALIGAFAQLAHPQQVISPYLSLRELGAFTGHCGAEYLKHLQIGAVLLGHSEQRAELSAQYITQQLYAAQKQNLHVILCVGEKNPHTYQKELLEQIVSIQSHPCLSLSIAYEPQWAIGTGHACTPELCHKAITFLKEHISYASNVKFYYGGSVSLENAQDFLELDGIQGLLIGRLSQNKIAVKKLIEVLQERESIISEKDV